MKEAEVTFTVDDLEKFLGPVVSAVLTPLFFAVAWVLFFPLAIFYGWCDRFIWNWFAAPYFHLSPMSVWTAVAISMLVSLQTMNLKMVKDEKLEWFKPLVAGFFLHLLSLATAYIIHVRWQP
jgi:hypothetical protein